ncbi:MAG: DcaP family trimeric outer membrane transporter [Bacteroidetes bacterium]|nr:DcaP family trimeric outer membrane transporter [Bacteroidota bacterium]MCL2303019.1 DcaP family trimeric outer membrane transporter [Lentimicrobiaceae bacterium]
MKYNFSFYMLIFCMLAYSSSFAQQDSISHTKAVKKALDGTIIRISDTLWFRGYNPEQGYFQKANFDKGDPRFMVANENQTFKFGIGGSVKVVAFADFNGSIANNDFITSLISIPTYHYGQFRIFANQSRLNVKVVGRIRKHTIVSFIEGNFAGANNAFKLRHAYVSFLGLTVGQTWTTFMDLQASPPTIDGEGPNNQIALRHPMIRYTYYYKDKLQVAVAAEMSEVLMTEIPTEPFKVYMQPQRVPDFVAQFKYQDKFGHVQLGAILRIMNHGDSTITKKSTFVPGGGLALSGTFHLWNSAMLYYQFNGGKGIASYIQDLSLFNYDLLPTLGAKKMNTVWMYGGYLGLQQYWTKKVHSNVVYGITRLETPADDYGYFEAHIPWYYKYGQYLAINTIWNFFDFASAGIELLWGQRVNLNGEKGHAHRVNLLLQYDF